VYGNATRNQKHLQNEYYEGNRSKFGLPNEGVPGNIWSQLKR
jgi:hypothetical protein